MSLMIIISAIILVASKIPDLFTTLVKIKVIDDERNPLARACMHKLGIRNGLYFIFGVYQTIAGVFVYICYLADSFWWDLQLILSAIIIGVFNVAVAHYNWYQRHNYFTRLIGKVGHRFYG